MEVDLDDLLKLVDSVTIDTHSPSNEVVELNIDDLISGACMEFPYVVRSSPDICENPGTSELLRDIIPSKLNLPEELSVESNVADFKVQNSTPPVPISERLDDSNASSDVKLVYQQDKISSENTTFLSPQIALKSEDAEAKKTLSSDTDESDSDLEDYSWMDLVELTGFKLKSATSTAEEIYDEIGETLNHQRCYKPTILLNDCSEMGMILKPVLSDKKVAEKCREKIKTLIKPFDFSTPSPDACVRQRRLGTNVV
jgi:hypothetical protein